MWRCGTTRACPRQTIPCRLSDATVQHYIDLITQFIHTNQAWAGPLLGLAAFGESLVLLGFFIPATALLLVAGTLMGSEVLPVTSTLVWLVVGSTLGDAVSYWLGRWAGPSLMRRWPLRGHRRGVAHARLFFIRYGFVAIFLGRFLGPVRSTIPLVAGMMRMRERPFQLANVGSAVVWVFTLIAPGYLVARGAAAAGMMGPEQILTTLTLVVILSVLGTLVGARFFQHAARKREARGTVGR